MLLAVTLDPIGRARMALLGALLLAASPGDARALDNPFPEDSAIVSPGVKLGYTFGEEGGFTFGIELSVLVRTGPSLSVVLAHGPVLDLSWTWDGIFVLHAGYELASVVLGVEAGPSLVVGRGGTRFGFGVTPWLGGIVVAPYYGHTFVVGAEPLDELGSYLKLPICTGPDCGSSGGTGFDFDDD
jgi:hypothetical protein